MLAWRLIGLQILIVIGAIATVTYRLHVSWTSYISQNVTATIANALYVGKTGNLGLRSDSSLHALLRHNPNLWFVVEDEKGRQLEYGEIPPTYRPLVPSLAQLRNSEIHTDRAPYTLNLRIDLIETAFGHVRIMCGGAARANPIAMFIFITRYLGWRMVVPLALVMLIVLPWLIRRSISGAKKLAKQAQAINFDERGVRLDDEAMPYELRPLVQAFNAALERLSEGYDARDRFLASAAHELRLPIAILETRLETLEAGATRTRLLADLARLSNLTEQLLNLQRLNRQLGKLEPINLVDLSQEVVADVAPLAIDAGYSLAIDAPNTPVMVNGDRASLSRVLANLLQNAIAYGGSCGSITVDVKVDGSFGVSDDGSGIPIKERSRIFEPFYRLRQSSTGSGLGLHLVKEIITLHGGKVEVAETASGGAWFRVHLPTLVERRAGPASAGITQRTSTPPTSISLS